jgi:hypothetical protein
MSEVNITEADPNRTKDIAAALGLCYTYSPQVGGMAQEIVKLIVAARAEGRAEAKAPPGCIVDEQGLTYGVVIHGDFGTWPSEDMMNADLTKATKLYYVCEAARAAKEASDD